MRIAAMREEIAAQREEITFLKRKRDGGDGDGPQKGSAEVGEGRSGRGWGEIVV